MYTVVLLKPEVPHNGEKHCFTTSSIFDEKQLMIDELFYNFSND